MIKSTRPLKTKEEVVALRAKKARISRAKKRMYVTGRLSRSEMVDQRMRPPPFMMPIMPTKAAAS